MTNMLNAYQPLTMWDVVHPSYWYPLTSLEQSLMDLNALSNVDMPVQTYCIMEAIPPSTSDEPDDFFRDLPVVAQGSPETKDVSTNADDKAQSFSYSYSSSSVADDKGCIVQSIRRRYEDASGRLKATHERRLPGKKVVTTWQKAGKDDEGKQDTICSEGTTKDEFDEEWKKTPFAKAKVQKTIGGEQTQEKICKPQEQPPLEGESKPAGEKVGEALKGAAAKVGEVLKDAAAKVTNSA
ncbi:hypothetical protein B5M09_009348 [Aphanomyces astaci]|uniref:Uncharacterized protein n=1 Tax=Aphanomyces astaci TaxID=112090 RepID=A0A3R7WAB7_APHAT|nr:hypothetical protein B5M09_009348 [Aphanomyces astaci]